MVTVLRNEVIEEPRTWNNQKFAGKTELRYNGGGEFIGCEFDGQSFNNGVYSLFVDGRLGFRPKATFRDCKFHGAKKAAVAQFCGFYGCHFYEAEDGLFSSAINGQQGYLHVERCQFFNLGLGELDHADGFQATAGRWYTLRQNFFDMTKSVVGIYGNSCVFLETKDGPISNVTIIGHRGTSSQIAGLYGGGHALQFYDDGHGPIRGLNVSHNDAGEYLFSPWVWNTTPINFRHEDNNW